MRMEMLVVVGVCASGCSSKGMNMRIFQSMLKFFPIKNTTRGNVHRGQGSTVWTGIFLKGHVENLESYCHQKLAMKSCKLFMQKVAFLNKKWSLVFRSNNVIKFWVKMHQLFRSAMSKPLTYSF